VKPPRIARAQLAVPTVAQLRSLIEVARGSVWEAPVLLAATTGMRIDAAVSRLWSSDRSAATTLAPSRANARAVARPMPLPAPVMKATLSANRLGMLVVTVCSACRS
jgi:hypothetical protein